MQDSTYKPRVEPRRLPKDAPNILIILLDDVGAAQTSTFGGLINTPTMDRIAKGGIAYNCFHATAMCSPTRAALLCGRNQHRVGSGQIAELANDWDGYSGTIPKSSATVAEVLKDYGYATAAFGKWHNTPAEQTTAAGPFDYWPAGYGFEYFYGFLAGEASQYEPCLVRNTTCALAADVLSAIGTFWTAPAYSTELVHVFEASGLTKAEPAKLDDDEDIELERLPLASALGALDDAASIAALALWLERG